MKRCTMQKFRCIDAKRFITIKFKIASFRIYLICAENVLALYLFISRTDLRFQMIRNLSLMCDLLNLLYNYTRLMLY